MSNKREYSGDDHPYRMKISDRYKELVKFKKIIVDLHRIHLIIYLLSILTIYFLYKHSTFFIIISNIILHSSYFLGTTLSLKYSQSQKVILLYMQMVMLILSLVTLLFFVIDSFFDGVVILLMHVLSQIIALISIWVSIILKKYFAIEKIEKKK